MSKNVRRLYDQFHPENYKLSITVEPDKMRFSGTVNILGKKTGKPSNRLTFHQKDLKVTRAVLNKIEKGQSREIEVQRINNHAGYDEVRLHAGETLYPGQYDVYLEYSAPITEPMHGIYPSRFEHEGKEKIILATQFESHHAREVFPGIDEPEAKATFDLTISSPLDQTVLANTEAEFETQLNGLKVTRFETTPVMSTYLLAFAVGDIHSVESQTKDGIKVRTWGSAAQPANMLKYANDEAVTILEFFTDYFQTPFPLKKIDQLALPDFESGAMENWGLITYREVALLADPDNRSQSSEQYVSMVVAHELSHQWFGNLVTMKWWDDLWLNESFASLMEHIALDKLHPDWFQWEQYTASDVIACSSRDVFKDVQPVHVEVNHPDEISTLFDPAIVYAKGGRLLKMMLDYIGEDAFRKALKSYFKKYAYKNTVGDDLWAEMSAASGKDINGFMEPWLAQSGMPALSVNHLEDTIILSQHRFVLDSNNDKSLWPIPLLADTELEKDIMTSREMTVSRPENKCVIFNHNGSGHMIVKYEDKAARQHIADAFSSQTLEPSSRINILNDFVLLSRKGDSPLTEALDVIREAPNEPRDAVWSIIARAIATSIHLTEGNEQAEKSIKKFRAGLVRNWYDKLGWDDQDGDSTNDKALRQTILSMMVASEDNDAVEECIRRYESAKSVTNLPAEQRAMIVGAIIKRGVDIVDDLIEEYKTTNNPDVQLAICAGLTNTRDPKVGQYIIDQALGKNGFVRPQDIFRWYGYLMRNRHTRADAWQWLQDNWKRLEKLFGDSKSFEYFVVFSAAPINTPDWQKKFEEFFKPMLDVIALRRNIKVGLSEIQTRVEWRQREEASLINYFSA